jgi:hypothetical protein
MGERKLYQSDVRRSKKGGYGDPADTETEPLVKGQAFPFFTDGTGSLTVRVISASS